MPTTIKINFRDGTKLQFPDPKSPVVNYRGYEIQFGDGIVTVIDPYENKTIYPLDLIASVEAQPQARW